eukprot:TRINITY_DN46287_c0_g1_i1.p2 TRINITY_DN46287_c0_g1~~TRINITY_DN46287_c0_g1_i1.p2  ORF type:complete len:247 (-),score=89.82 TRINITY_DN46287_c0_g1_i1:248-988(-)
MPSASSAMGLQMEDDMAKKRKGQGQGDASKQQIQKQIDMLTAAVTDVAILASQSAREVALVKSATVHTTVFSVKDSVDAMKVVDTLQATTKTYAAKTKEMMPAQRSQYGSPHVFVWFDLISTYAELTKGNDDLKRHHDKLTAHLQDLENQANAMIMENKTLDKQEALRTVVSKMVPICRLQRCWTDTNFKLEINTKDSTSARDAENAVVTILVTTAKGHFKSGQAPRSNAERKVQGHLDKLKADDN